VALNVSSIFALTFTILCICTICLSLCKFIFKNTFINDPPLIRVVSHAYPYAVTCTRTHTYTYCKCRETHRGVCGARLHTHRGPRHPSSAVEAPAVRMLLRRSIAVPLGLLAGNRTPQHGHTAGSSSRHRALRSRGLRRFTHTHTHTHTQTRTDGHTDTGVTLSVQGKPSTVAALWPRTLPSQAALIG